MIFFEDTKCDLKEWFDTSNYDKNMLLPDEYVKNVSINKKVIGKMKNEIGNGHIINLLLYLLKDMHQKNMLLMEQ